MNLLEKACVTIAWTLVLVVLAMYLIHVFSAPAEGYNEPEGPIIVFNTPTPPPVSAPATASAGVLLGGAA